MITWYSTCHLLLAPVFPASLSHGVSLVINLSIHWLNCLFVFFIFFSTPPSTPSTPSGLFFFLPMFHIIVHLAELKIKHKIDTAPGTLLWCE
uniref:Uncharacterized protein n=1 Tax=Anopheles darlingi TaxID=43151 RepID=A0A2M4DGB3_ANODA